MPHFGFETTKNIVLIIKIFVVFKNAKINKIKNFHLRIEPFSKYSVDFIFKRPSHGCINLFDLSTKHSTFAVSSKNPTGLCELVLNDRVSLT